MSRHNGNLLIDAKGHIIHIDFGFILTIGPSVLGNVFENAPFKLTQDYLGLIGGESSPLFTYFQLLLIRGFEIVRRNMDELCDLLDIMSKQSTLQCFEKFELKEFRERMKPGLTTSQIPAWVTQLTKDSLTSKRTVWYDDFQKVSNGIIP